MHIRIIYLFSEERTNKRTKMIFKFDFLLSMVITHNLYPFRSGADGEFLPKDERE